MPELDHAIGIGHLLGRGVSNRVDQRTGKLKAHRDLSTISLRGFGQTGE